MKEIPLLSLARGWAPFPRRGHRGAGARVPLGGAHVWGWPCECAEVRVTVRTASLPVLWGKDCICQKDPEISAEPYLSEKFPQPSPQPLIPYCFGQIFKIPVFGLSFLFEK